MQFKSDKELPQGSGGGGLFVRLKDGDSIRGVFAGEIFDHVPIDNFTKKPKFKFRINFVIQENGAYAAKILERGITEYKSLRTLVEKGYNLERTVMLFSRTGSGMDDTEYTLLPAPVPQLTDEEVAQIKAVKLNDLAEKK